MTLHDDLVAAKALIDTPEKWGKGQWKNEETGCLCAIGALREALHTTAAFLGEPEDLLKSVLPEGWLGFYVEDFNDEPSTTHADIMALFDRAIAAALLNPIVTGSEVGRAEA